MVKMIIDVSMYVFEALLFLFYCYTAFNNRYNKLLTVSLFFVAYGLLFGVLQFGNIYANMISNIVVCILLIYFLFESKIISAIFHSIIFYAFLIISEYITIPIISIVFRIDFESIADENLAYMIAAIASKIIHLICCMIVLSVYRKIKNKESKNGFSLMLLIPIFNIVMFELIVIVTKDVPYKNLYLIWIVCGILMLFSSILVFFNRYHIIKQANKVNELEIENKKKDLDKQYLSILEKSNDDMQILAHDFKNHLIQLNSFTELEDVNKYINKIYPDVDKFASTGISDNKTLDLIINKYYSLCELKGISFDLDVRTTNLIQIDNVDLSALLNNLLDNALEAAEKGVNGYISFKVFKDTEYYDKIVILNSCIEKPMTNNKKLISSKRDTLLHGIGVKSVKKIVKKYKGIYNWEYNEDNKEFITTISIPR